MAAGRDDNDVYPQQGIRIDLYVHFDHSETAKGEFGMSQCADVMPTGVPLLNVVSCIELRWDAPFEVVLRTELLYYKIGNFICMLINMII